MIEFIRKHYGKLGMSFALVMLVINYFQRQELTRLRNEPKIEVFTGGDIEKGKVIDSLQGEIFILNTTIGRYELTLEHLYEVNPKAAKQFDEFLQHETE
jgi:hypothetical protein